MSRVPPTLDHRGPRWSKPARILDVEEAENLVQMPSGEIMQDVMVSVDDETLERMKQGYICKNCLEPQETPFPEVCMAQKLPDGTVVGCYYRMRDRQLRDLHMQHRSLEEVQIGSKLNRRDELERLREIDEYEERTGLLLPPSVKFPQEGSVTTFRKIQH